jgi:hypothetical protein
MSLPLGVFVNPVVFSAVPKYREIHYARTVPDQGP